jgi:hypothetical protein
MSEALPGEELITAGLEDLEHGVESIEALPVSIGGPRLRDLGIPVAGAFDNPEHRLYERLRAEDPDAPAAPPRSSSAGARRPSTST